MQDPINKVIIVQRVATFASRSLKDIVHLSYVSDTWSDTIQNYAFHLFKNLIRADNALVCRSCFLKALEVNCVWLSEVMAEFFLFQRRPNLIWEEAVDLGKNGGDTPLGYAARKNRLELVKILLEKNSPVNLYDHTGFNAFHHAVNSGSPELVQLFLDRSKKVSTGNYSLDKQQNGFVRINAVTEKEESPLLLAVKNLVLSSTSQKKENNDINYSRASSCRQIIDMILKTPKCQIEAVDEKNNNILHYLCSEWGLSNDDNIKSSSVLLLQDLLLNDDGQKSEIFIEDDDIRKQLLLDVTECKNEHGDTPFSVACASKNIAAAQILIEAAMKLSSENSSSSSTTMLNNKTLNRDGLSPLQLAVKSPTAGECLCVVQSVGLDYSSWTSLKQQQQLKKKLEKVDVDNDESATSRKMETTVVEFPAAAASDKRQAATGSNNNNDRLNLLHRTSQGLLDEALSSSRSSLQGTTATGTTTGQANNQILYPSTDTINKLSAAMALNDMAREEQLISSVLNRNAAATTAAASTTTTTESKVSTGQEALRHKSEQEHLEEFSLVEKFFTKIFLCCLGSSSSSDHHQEEKFSAASLSLYQRFLNSDKNLLNDILRDICVQGNFKLFELFLTKIVTPVVPNFLNLLFSAPTTSDDSTTLLHFLVRQQAATSVKNNPVRQQSLLEMINKVLLFSLSLDTTVTSSKRKETVIHECVRFADEYSSSCSSEDSSIMFFPTKILESIILSSPSSSTSQQNNNNNQNWNLEAENNEGETPILLAAKLQNYKQLELLWKKFGANIRAENTSNSAISTGRNVESIICHVRNGGGGNNKNFNNLNSNKEKKLALDRLKLLDDLLLAEDA